MLEETNYKKKLHESLHKIKDYFDFSAVRESEIASFIFAEKDNRAIEIYQSENFVIIEFWENQDSASFVKEVNSYEEATDLAIEWVDKQI